MIKLFAQAVEVSPDCILVGQVFGIGLELSCAIILKPQAVARGLAVDFISPAVAVACNVVAACWCSELHHFHSLSGLSVNSVYGFLEFRIRF